MDPVCRYDHGKLQKAAGIGAETYQYHVEAINENGALLIHVSPVSEESTGS